MMKSVEMPSRSDWAEDFAKLVELDTGKRETASPAHLSLSDILEMPSLFQPRGQSLGFCPGASARHIEGMSRTVTQGRVLDPVAVVAFGSQWVLVDGHHRLAAYRDAGHTETVPVVAHDYPATGKERVTWAVAVSTRLNAKDKLSMSADDKVDSAWRMVVMVAYEMTKDQLVEITTVRDRTIGNMRAVRKALLEAGCSTEELYGLSWRGANRELERRRGNARELDPEWEEKRLRHLVRKLTPVIHRRLPASLLLEALEKVRPGIELELETVINFAKKERKALERARAELDI